MKLHHIAFWTRNIDALVEFYERHFSGEVLFRHQSSDFHCILMKICSSITIEIMTQTNLGEGALEDRIGYSHFSLEVDSKEEVNRLTDYFIEHKVPMGKIREQYDDGFYESSVLDPDGNMIEIAYVDRRMNPAV